MESSPPDDGKLGDDTTCSASAIRIIYTNLYSYHTPKFQNFMPNSHESGVE
jgi:hypothetical protein